MALFKVPGGWKFGAAAGGVLAAGALFAGGTLTGFALDDGVTVAEVAQAPDPAEDVSSELLERTVERESPVAAESDDGAERAVLAVNPSGTAAPVQGGGGYPAGMASGRGGGDMAASYAYGGYGYYGGCQAPLGQVIDGDLIDPLLAGFQLRSLGAAFEVTNISLSAYGDCGPDGTVTDVDLVMSSGWRHIDSGMQLWLEQRQTEDEVARLYDIGYLTFSDGGYAFSLSGGYSGFPAGSDPVLIGDFEMDGGQVAAFDQAIADLAPDLGPECFYTPKQGTWDELIASGVGDVRPLIPPGWTEDYFDFRSYYPPSADCGGAGLAPQAGHFNVSWSADNQTRSINVGGWMQPEGSPDAPGYLDTMHASWNSETYSYSIGTSVMGDSTPTVLELASALDPQFDATCVMESTQLTEEALATHGLTSPLAPAGFTRQRFEGYADLLKAECTRDFDYEGNLWASWSFNSPDTGQLDISVSKTFGENPGPYYGGYGGQGWISDYSINWSDEAGTSYNINIYDPNGSSDFEGPGRDALIAVALSMDPTFDPDTLLEGGNGYYGGGPYYYK